MSARIVFMGTPDFAVPCLEKLLELGCDIPAVFTQPDRPKGRGQQLQPPPVKRLATERGIPVYQPTKLRDGTVRELLREMAPDLAVVVAYGRLLPADLLELPKFGCINVHASLLPQYRGAAPIQWSVINGDGETGVTIMHLAEEMDAGDIIARERTAIGAMETAGELFGRLSAMGAELLGRTVPLLLEGKAERTPQDHSRATFAPMIEKSMSYISFEDNPRGTACRIHGLNPSPGAHTLFEGKRLRLLRAKPAEGQGEPGTVLHADPFVVACGDGALELVKVKPEGKGAMTGAAFANGRRLRGGEKLGE